MFNVENDKRKRPIFKLRLVLRTKPLLVIDLFDDGNQFKYSFMGVPKSLYIWPRSCVNSKEYFLPNEDRKPSNLDI